MVMETEHYLKNYEGMKERDNVDLTFEKGVYKNGLKRWILDRLFLTSKKLF
jgi:hypothetical protein